MVDVLGFAASALIVVSLTMRSIVRLRLVGMLGAAAFIAYGLWLLAWPVVTTNVITLSIHVFRLRHVAGERQRGRRSRRAKDRLPHSEGSTPGSVSLR